MRRCRAGWHGRWMLVVATAFAPALPGPSVALAQAGPPTDVDLPRMIPIFPLPDVTLFPNTRRPFHIFEARYRTMIADALEGNRIIGMVLLEPGNDADYEGRPPVYAVGCAGVIIASEELPDGRYNVVLEGLSRFRIVSEDDSRSYRLATVESLDETLDPGDRPLLEERRRQLEAALEDLFPGAQLPPPDLSDEEVVNELALALPLAPASRQELLEADGPVARATQLIGLIRGTLQAMRQTRSNGAPVE